MSILTVIAATALAAWLYLLFARSGFWRADQRLPTETPVRPDWPEVAVVVPARNEAAYIGRAVGSLLRQDYRGDLTVILVDDRSEDGTAEAATAAARENGAADRLIVSRGEPLPSGWTGKTWAMFKGQQIAEQRLPAARYILFTDADIEHDPGNLGALVAKAESEGLDMASLMVRLHCRGFVERLLIPAFVFFFQKLYPFPAINDRHRPTAGAAGGCVLVRRQALANVGGIEAIKGELIDDCALARRIKAHGGAHAIWLGLTETTKSIRPYDGLPDVWNMVARTAYTQLGYSIPTLAVTVVGMALLYVMPPLAGLLGVWTGDWISTSVGAAAWILMAIAYLPTLRLYGQPLALALLLPVAAVLYELMTIDSARRHYRGEGGGWKGRTYSPA